MPKRVFVYGSALLNIVLAVSLAAVMLTGAPPAPLPAETPAPTPKGQEQYFGGGNSPMVRPPSLNCDYIFFGDWEVVSLLGAYHRLGKIDRRTEEERKTAEDIVGTTLTFEYQDILVDGEFFAYTAEQNVVVIPANEKTIPEFDLRDDPEIPTKDYRLAFPGTYYAYLEAHRYYDAAEGVRESLSMISRRFDVVVMDENTLMILSGGFAYKAKRVGDADNYYEPPNSMAG